MPKLYTFTKTDSDKKQEVFPAGAFHPSPRPRGRSPQP